MLKHIPCLSFRSKPEKCAATLFQLEEPKRASQRRSSYKSIHPFPHNIVGDIRRPTFNAKGLFTCGIQVACISFLQVHLSTYLSSGLLINMMNLSWHSHESL